MMSKEKNQDPDLGSDQVDGNDPEAMEDEEPALKVEDKRHWARKDKDDDGEEPEVPDTRPTIIGEYRQRAEKAEEKLQEYIAAFKEEKKSQEEFRQRLQKDVDRKVELKFGGLVVELLEGLDDLDLALSHVADVPEARELAHGVELVRNRFLATLEKHGVARLDPAGQPFDPETAEAIGVIPVDDATMDGAVVETYRAGYMLGDRVIRPARVAVGKKS
jgi:molecular chaperone GrpE